VKQVKFHNTARLELLDALTYYCAISPILAKRLALAVEEAIELVRAFPDVGIPYLQQTRRVFPKRFPFSIVYVEAESEILVIAVAPFRRKPGYWLARLTR
jgi:plasmid stabilization system protein ParE